MFIPCEMYTDSDNAQHVELVIRSICFQFQLCHQLHLVTQTTLTTSSVLRFSFQYLKGAHKKHVDFIAGPVTAGQGMMVFN